jgi:hypothetical protein
MSLVSRGFRGRRQTDVDPARLPPDQYVTRDFPVLSAGPTPHTPHDEWTLTIGGAVNEARSWTWERFLELPSEVVTRDIHCVTTSSTPRGVEWRWTRCSTARSHGASSWWPGATAATPPTCRWRMSPAARLGWRTNTVGAARPGTRRASAPARAAPLRLEEREVGPWIESRGPRRARLLGVLRLPQLRRSWKEQRYWSDWRRARLAWAGASRRSGMCVRGPRRRTRSSSTCPAGAGTRRASTWTSA